MITKLNVQPTSSNNYEIILDSELNFSYISNFINQKQVLIVTNTTIEKIYLDKFLSSIKAEAKEVSICILDDGEEFKSQQSLDKIINSLLENNYTRSATMLIALGGGVIGDITGFAASIYQRGVDFIQIPTTLLSQVDSSVGGKTAINHQLGKNMIGTFYQPKLVYTSPQFYKTLPEREYISGMAEVSKYGCISESFFNFLCENIESINKKDPKVLIEMVKKSCEIKAQIVAVDEYDLTGRRALLNFGHTFGHAIEKCQKYRGLKHGEAVGVGMYMAMDFSSFLGLINKDIIEKVSKLLRAFNIPSELPKEIGQEEFYNAMLLDKKNDKGEIKFILMSNIGNLEVIKVEEAKVKKFLSKYF
ncbi:3-dehydroquinate synthase [Francisella frigiditurris]|uniref:3-dehydroquinate synthase n=1 Tax=Francisella frigiditurris TaxID=1542390 RepID=A0A1J0KVJ6_9GAMM|nr:3-dehydroquinate synthase [Francisella frigiditurris]APC97711.1 3-dehydroquinate synthase [Francisella frigiditurris]